MARTTGNVAPSGFVAGQLRDGASIGVFDWANSSKFEIRVRYYQGKLISEIRWQNGGTWGNWVCQARGYFENLKGGHTAGPYTELNDSVPLFATEAEIIGLGIPMPGGVVPVNPTNALIPFQADADGRVTAYSAPADSNKVIEKLAEGQNNLVNALTGGTTTTTTTGGTTTTSGMRNALITVGIVAGVVLVGVLLWRMFKKK